jgi:flagellar basal-body rod modification protein FlgD
MNEISSDFISQFQQPVNNESRPRDELGQSEFMELMLTQMRHQDPFKPMENGDFIAQMAQFSSVAGIDDMRASLDTFVSNNAATQALQSATLLDRQVLIESHTAQPSETGTLDFEFNLPASSGAVTVTITDAQGQLVEKLNLGPHGHGDHGHRYVLPEQHTSDTSNPFPVFRVDVESIDADGVAVATPVYTAATIDSVRLNQGGTAAVLGTSDGREFSVTEVRKFF